VQDTSNIILIGFMGVGKGRTARALAALTGRFAVDTDDLIESKTKSKIRHIFAEQGEGFFRSLEQQLADWLEQHVSGTVVSTGGGFFKVNNLSKLGRVIYLHAPVEDILHTMQQQENAKKKLKKRPLLHDIEQAKSLFSQRLPLYRAAAEFEVAVGEKTAEVLAQEIVTLLKK
jgi:shikimate kinase